MQPIVWVSARVLTRTSRGLRTGYAYQPPAQGSLLRAACSGQLALCTYALPYTYQPRACRTYHVPWHTGLLIQRTLS